MPTINISPVVRFVLYILAAISLIVVAYAVDKTWAGDAEVRLVTSLAALLNLLAAAKTDFHEPQVRQMGAQVAETHTAVEQLTADVSHAAERGAAKGISQAQRRNQSGEAGFNYLAVLALVAIVVLLLAVAGVF